MTHPHTTCRPGTVYLVGSGPGDPELMTLKAARLVREADVIVYDHLGAEGVLDLARPDAEKIYAGKEASNHALPQEEINVLLVRLAKQKKRVVRLKGGDPFIFGRGGEEVEQLRAAGVEARVINGVTAGLAGLSSLGAPLTHRDRAHGVVFITGHAKPGDAGTDWRQLAATAHAAKLTLVIYMGVSSVRQIGDELLAGLPAIRETPVTGSPRLPLCLMGVCFDCLAEIDGVPNRQACMVTVAPGMRIARQHGARAARP